MSSSTGLDRQAKLFSRYLIQSAPTVHHMVLYRQAMAGKPVGKTVQTVISHPWLLPLVDAHDALFRPNSELRQYLYLMFAVLEASTEYTDKFLPQLRSVWFALVMPLIGIRAGLRLIGGVIVVRLARL